MATQERSESGISRFLRTDFYFQQPGMPLDEDSSLSVVFFKDEDENVSTTSKRPTVHLSGVRLVAGSEYVIQAIMFNQHFGRQTDSATFLRTTNSFARQLAHQPVVTENSPPISTILSRLVQHAPLGMGMLVGTGVSPDPVIAMASVVGGTIVMGAAIGISTGLQRGLAEIVKDWITMALAIGSVKKLPAQSKPPKVKPSAKKKAPAKVSARKPRGKKKPVRRLRAR